MSIKSLQAFIQGKMERRTADRPANIEQLPSAHDFKSAAPGRASLRNPTQCELMEHARNQASFDTTRMTEIILGGKETVARQNEIFARVERTLGTDDLSKLPLRYGNQNREEILLDGVRIGRVTVNDSIEHKHGLFWWTTNDWVLANSNPFGLNFVLFIPMLELQASPEQLSRWLPLAESGQIVGSYSQTELGHGTFVAGIQTTATFDKETDEFVIHTPNLSATKYWPGALAFASTHTIVIARMIIDGKDYGVHSFVMQIRSLEDFKPVKGVELGDMGLKMAYNGVDNGYAIFDHVRIPRNNLLSRYNTVSRHGIYKCIPLREKLLYGGMLGGRATIIRNCAFQFAQALTIATRYSVVRQQGQKNDLDDSMEPVIMSYKLQHYRLLTLISKAYANIFASMSASAVRQDLLEAQARGDHASLPYAHMLMAGLKAWSTQTAADGAEEARKMCGGQGYLMISGLPAIVNSVVSCCTFEGENTVMWKQVSNYLIKGLSGSALPRDMAYMRGYRGPFIPNYQGDDFLRPEVLIDIFEHRAAQLAHEAHDLVGKEESKIAKAEHKYAVEFQIAARAHIDVYILQSFFSHISSLPFSTPEAIYKVLHHLLCLFALTTISCPLSSSSSTFHLSSPQIQCMRKLTDELLEQLVPDAIALTDAWNFTDASLASALGCRDGDVYRRLMEWTRQLPMNVRARENDGVLPDIWEEGVKPFLLEGRARAKL